LRRCCCDRSASVNTRLSDIKVKCRSNPVSRHRGTKTVRRRRPGGENRSTGIWIALRIGPGTLGMVVRWDGRPTSLTTQSRSGNQDLTHHRCCNIPPANLWRPLCGSSSAIGRSVNVQVDGPIVTERHGTLIDAALHGEGWRWEEEWWRRYRRRRAWSSCCWKTGARRSRLHLYYPNGATPSPAFVGSEGTRANLIISREKCDIRILHS